MAFLLLLFNGTWLAHESESQMKFIQFPYFHKSKAVGTAALHLYGLYLEVILMQYKAILKVLGGHYLSWKLFIKPVQSRCA